MTWCARNCSSIASIQPHHSFDTKVEQWQLASQSKVRPRRSMSSRAEEQTSSAPAAALARPAWSPHRAAPSPAPVRASHASQQALCCMPAAALWPHGPHWAPSCLGGAGSERERKRTRPRMRRDSGSRAADRALKQHGRLIPAPKTRVCAACHASVALPVHTTSCMMGARPQHRGLRHNNAACGDAADKTAASK